MSSDAVIPCPLFFSIHRFSRGRRVVEDRIWAGGFTNDSSHERGNRAKRTSIRRENNLPGAPSFGSDLLVVSGIRTAMKHLESGQDIHAYTCRTTIPEGGTTGTGCSVNCSLNCFARRHLRSIFSFSWSPRLPTVLHGTVRRTL